MITRGRKEHPAAIKATGDALAVLLVICLIAVDVAAARRSWVVSQPHARAQLMFLLFQPQAPVKSKIEQELEKKNTPGPTTSTSPGKKRRTTSRSVSGHASVASAEESLVTFVSDVPGAEILVDGAIVGRTDENKRLTVRVRKGQHKATANLKGYNSQATTISVFADKSTLAINLGAPLPAPAPTPTPIANEAVTPVPEPPARPSVDEIIKRFISPKETNSLRIEDWKEVISQSDEALRSEPTNPQFAARAHLGRAQVAYLSRNYPESLTEFNRAITALPHSGIAYYGLGNAYLATNQPLQATKSYQRAAALTPEMAAVAFKGVGDALTKLGKGSEANDSYEEARKLGYSSPDINRSIALNLIEDKEWRKAVAELAAIENSDSSAELQLYMGECYENLKRPVSAYRAYAAASRLDPNSPVAFSKLGNLLYAHNEFSEAKEAFERALALDTTGSTINRQVLRKLADKAASLAK